MSSKGWNAACTGVQARASAQKSPDFTPTLRDSGFALPGKGRPARAARAGAVCVVANPRNSWAIAAVLRGWAPPLAWDEDSIDSPEAPPNPGRHETLTFRDRYLELRDCGYNDLFIAQRLNIRPESLGRQLLRHNMPISDLLQTEITATKNRTPSGAA